MKRLVLVLLVVFSITIFAQETTLLSGTMTNGGYGSPEIKYTQVGNNSGLLTGGKGGWIINHTLIIGGGCYGLVNNIQTNTIIDGSSTYLSFEYGGLVLEYIKNSDDLLHFTFSALIGGGSVNFRNAHDEKLLDEDDAATFFIFEPGVSVEANITSFFRVNLGVSNRFLSNVNMDRFNQENLGGLSSNLTFKFGEF